jgi:isopenicillin N synthase-like dioxygenase
MHDETSFWGFSAGLYCRSRHSELIKVNIPKDHIGFQIGETAQIHSGGVLQATPHAVRGSNQAGVTRETFAVFMEPNWTEPMEVPEGTDIANAQSQSSAQNLPKGVPSINSRWKPGMTFSDFTNATLAFYY